MSRIALVLSFCLTIVLPRASAQMLEDVVYLKDGSMIRGTIIQQIPNAHLTIRITGGSTFTYAMSEIIRITKEPSVSMPVIKEKNPGIALLLSFLVTGAGQAYNEEWTKAAIYFGLTSLNFAFWANDDYSIDSISFIGVTAGVLESIIDAPMSAIRINKKHREQRLSLTPLNSNNGSGASLTLRF